MESYKISNKADYLEEAKKHLAGDEIYKEVKFKKTLFQLVHGGNNYFKKLECKEHSSEKELSYFTYEYKKTCNLGKLCLLPEINKISQTVTSN